LTHERQTNTLGVAIAHRAHHCHWCGKSTVDITVSFLQHSCCILAHSYTFTKCFKHGQQQRHGPKLLVPNDIDRSWLRLLNPQSLSSLLSPWFQITSFTNWRPASIKYVIGGFLYLVKLFIRFIVHTQTTRCTMRLCPPWAPTSTFKFLEEKRLDSDRDVVAFPLHIDKPATVGQFRPHSSCTDPAHLHTAASTKTFKP